MPINSADAPLLLVLNTGSSSLKFAVFESNAALVWRLYGELQWNSHGSGHLNIIALPGQTVIDHEVASTSLRESLAIILDKIVHHVGGGQPIAAGHRVVHGGPFDSTVIATPDIDTELRRYILLAPLHQSRNLSGIAAVRESFPEMLQIACFDTAFHKGLPRLARMTSLPRHFEKRGIRRHGFHGLSYEYVVQHLRETGVDVRRERIVAAHLGNGASMCAILNGQSVEVTTGLSTLGGLPMGTRSGDLNPGIVLHLAMEQRLNLIDLQSILYEESGLLGMSGISHDMRELLSAPERPEAREAIEFFCYSAKRSIAALAAVLGGIDRLVFTGGIGANSPEVRSSICAGLEFLGVVVDHVRNLSGDGIISNQRSPVTIQALICDEQLVMAGQMLQLLQPAQPTAKV